MLRILEVFQMVNSVDFRYHDSRSYVEFIEDGSIFPLLAPIFLCVFPFPNLWVRGKTDNAGMSACGRMFGHWEHPQVPFHDREGQGELGRKRIRHRHVIFMESQWSVWQVERYQSPSTEMKYTPISTQNKNTHKICNLSW